MQADFDAIVVGSGITGGWAAKELTERGLKVLMIERGREVEHQKDYIHENKGPWELPFRGRGDPVAMRADHPLQSQSGFVNEYNQHFFANERENPYLTAADKPFTWIRGYQLGGKSLIWGRQTLRWSEYEFEANKLDGHGTDWPIRYADIAPWYDHCEKFIGVSGSHEGLPNCPDGIYQPAMPLNHVEAAFKAAVEAKYSTRKVIPLRMANMTEDNPDEGRTRCQYRNICSRGCSFGAYFSTQSSTLPAATRTGRLTILTDSRVVGVEYDPATKRATGVRVIDTRTKQRSVHGARLIFLCASTINSVHTLLLSKSEAFPNGLANSSGTLGRYMMDQVMGIVVGSVPGHRDRTYFGFKPSGFIIPRFRNTYEPKEGLLRSYIIQGAAHRASWTSAIGTPGVGIDYKRRIREPGGWGIALVPFAECLPREENGVTIDEGRPDQLGVPQVRIDIGWSANELALFEDATAESVKMIEAFGGKVVYKLPQPLNPGRAIHEMGGARMGHDPSSSVLNKFNQAHDVANLFVTDGSSMPSCGIQSPSLTFMALTARAAANATSMLKEGKI